ncbi:MAG: efflux RND transporter permease subunit [Lentisphaeria bacterium]|nr:efflux RND transporter permease subunit [Lentisphaeria bacterium]
MFSKIFIDRPRFAIVISLILVLAGVISLSKLPVAEYPEIAPPTLFVSAMYPGASGEVIAQTVAMPIEDQINGVDDLLYFSSTCSNDGSYSCEVTFQSGTDTDIAMVNLQNAIKRAEPQLPSDVTKLGISVEKRGNEILAVFVFMTDETTLNLMELNNYVNVNVKDSITRLEGVAAASVMSLEEYSMRIWLDPLRMAGLGISTSDISQAVQSQNIQAAAGSIGTEKSNSFMSFKLNVKGRLTTAEEFGNIVLRHDSDGSAVHLRDVAKVEVGSSSYAGRSLFNGKPCVGLIVNRTPDANAMSTVKRVNEELDHWKKLFPAGVSVASAYDPTEFIEVSMKEIVTTIVLALALVVLITWIFLQDWRATLIPSVAIPVAMIGTMTFLYALGYSINVLTMFGLILVVGSLCDDAIVVVENCQGLMEREGIGPKAAAEKTMRQITGAIISTTLVTVSCYVPLAFYGGMVGVIYVQFAVTMCISLCLSTTLAMTLSPALCAILLRRPDHHVPLIFRPFNAVLDFSRKIYLFFTGFLVRVWPVAILLFAGVLFAIYYMFIHTTSSFLPNEDKGVFFCNVELPSGASVERTDEVMDEILEKLKDVKGIRSVMAVSTFSMMAGNGENVGIAIIALDHWDKRKTPDLQADAIKNEVQQRLSSIPDARINVNAPPAINGLGAVNGVTAHVCGIGDIDPIALSDVMKGYIRELMGTGKFMFVMTPYNADSPQLYLDIDFEKAHTLGVSPLSIYTTLQSKLASLYINDFTMVSRNFKVRMQASADYRSTLDDIREIQVVNDVGEMVPLTSFGELKYTIGPRQISRFDKMTSAPLNANGMPGVSSRAVMDAMEQANLPGEYHLEWTGLSYQERQNEGQILYLLALAMLFAYLFLVAQYESWTIPVPVMLTVAFAVCGALIGLKIAHLDLSIYAQLGMVMLIGLSSKNAILMVEFAKQEREHGKSIVESALSGASLRYRAILMTAWSFIFGVYPLVVATGAGSGSRRAIGITTFSGMIMATLIGIMFTPALYAFFQRVRETGKRILHLDRPRE